MLYPVTPYGRPYTLRIPKGSEEEVAEALAKLNTFSADIYVVKQGGATSLTGAGALTEASPSEAQERNRHEIAEKNSNGIRSFLLIVIITVSNHFFCRVFSVIRMLHVNIHYYKDYSQ